MSEAVRRIAVLGAGVIGQVYAGRLAESGVEVWLLASGATLERLRADGLRLWQGERSSTPPIHVASSAAEVPPVDVAYLAVRADQVDGALEPLAAIQAPVVATLSNLAGQAEAVAARIGVERTIYGFPGVGGTCLPDGVHYVEIAQQPTTIGRAGGREAAVADDLRRAGFAVAVVDDPLGWLATHAVFVVGVGAAILAAGGSAAVGEDRRRTERMLLSVRDGFRALSRRGVAVTPAPLRTIFTRVPRLFAVPYWQRQLAGPLGTVALTPHVLATRDSEFPWLVDRVRELTGDPPVLGAALAQAGFSAARTD
jgi:2-dehydropantoate 2-reductase